MSNLVEIERAAGVARVWLNRPDRHNALNDELAAQLTSAFRQVAEDDAVRIVVVGGRGKSFCAGADIGMMRDAGKVTSEDNVRESMELGKLFSSLSDMAKPVIARVHGNCFGGGVGMMSACDLVVAADDCRFAISEVRLGIIPALISPYLLRRMGDARARELMLTGERFGSERGVAAGLIDHVVAAGELDAKVEERIEALLAGGPEAQGHIKRLLELHGNSGWTTYREALPKIIAEVRSGDEAQEGLGAFLEKRKPRWAESG